MKSLFEALASAFARLDGGTSVRVAKEDSFADATTEIPDVDDCTLPTSTMSTPTPTPSACVPPPCSAPATPPARRSHGQRTIETCHPLPLPPIEWGRLTVVLDLDETLVAAYPEPAPRAPRSWRKGPAPALVVAGVDLGEGRTGPVRCYLRPGLHGFLRAVSEIADVVLYTAGLPGYASPLCDALDPTRELLPVRLFRPTTVAAGGHSCVKDLTPLGRDLSRTVLVDNSPFSFLLQPACGLPAHPFDGDGADEHLLGSILPLLRHFARDPRLDVRPVLSSRFGMASWLAARGGWALYEAPCGNLAVATGYCSPPVPVVVVAPSKDRGGGAAAAASAAAPQAPTTPERKGGALLASAAGTRRRQRDDLDDDDDGDSLDSDEGGEGFDDGGGGFEDSAPSFPLWRPATPTTTLRAPRFEEEGRRVSGRRMRPMGAAVSVIDGEGNNSDNNGGGDDDGGERMMIEVAA